MHKKWNNFLNCIKCREFKFYSTHKTPINMNFSFTSGNFHLHKFNQNDNHQFSSNFNDNHQLRYSNQNLINSQSTSNPSSQPGKRSELSTNLCEKMENSEPGVSSFWKMAIYRFFIFYVFSLMSHREGKFFNCDFSRIFISSDKLNDSLWTELISASES